ncbi:MAG: superoxide dismutase [Alphaproteobacteria bacterium]
MHARSTSIGRRAVIKTGAAALAAVAAGRLAMPHVARAQAEGPIKVPPLPYKDDALVPVISANTIGFHYGKHHIGYATTLNAALAGPAKDYAALSLEDIIKTSRANPNRAGVFNAAAQVWNHDFYWSSMKPGGGGEPAAGKLKDEINKAFGDFAKFKEAFARAAIGQFGSGWGWLSWDEKAKKLLIEATSNAETPLFRGNKPILTIDVWEHAYYLDYQNRRADYVNAVIDKLINWEFAEKNLG